VFFSTVVVRTVGGLLVHRPRPEEAAQVLGANRWRTFVNVTLPKFRRDHRRGIDRLPSASPLSA
jgi:ABC-type sulfate transport system permease component